MTATDVVVRSAAITDAERITELASQLGYVVTQEMMERHLPTILQAPDNVVFVAEAGGQVIGWAHAFLRVLLTSPLNVELEGLVVDENTRSAGVGGMLVERVEAWGRDQGAEMINVRSNVIRERAHQFYLRRGYTIKKSQYTFTKALV